MSSVFIESKKKDFVSKTTFVFKPAFGTKDADYELLSFSEKKPSLGNFSRVDLFLLLNYLSQRGTSFSGALRGIIYVATKYAPRETILSEIEKASYLLDIEGEVGDSIDRASKTHSLDALKVSFSSDEGEEDDIGTYFALLKNIGYSSLDSEIEDELKEIFDFLTENSRAIGCPTCANDGKMKKQSKGCLSEEGNLNPIISDNIEGKNKNKNDDDKNDDFSDFLVNRSPFFRALSGMRGVLPERTKHIDTRINGDEYENVVKRISVPHPISIEAFPSFQVSPTHGVSENKRIKYSQKIFTYKTKTIRVRWNIQ